MAELNLISSAEAAVQRRPDAHARRRLPAPVKERWHPLRSGLVNLYRWDDEEFPFEQGRLLLRGHNGTGKSRVLALQLPFLLDGDISPHRVEPDGDSAKRMEWNLLMGRYDDRIGYTWIEFGRRLPDGHKAFLTLGCGLRAVEGRAGVTRWFFLTPRRIGADLALKTADDRPLSREQIEQAIGTDGCVIQGVEEWRRAVDDALFRLGPRYEALIELLIRLRQPQLSRKLDEKALSGALSNALAPLPAAVIDDVAEAFRSLEADRLQVQTFTAVRRAVGAFLDDYRRYLRTAIRRRAAAVRSTHAAYEDAQRQLRGAEQRKTDATAAREQARLELARLDGELAATEAAIRTLEDSPEMRSVRELQRARDDEVERGRMVDQARRDLDSAQTAVVSSTHVLEQCEAEAAEVADNARNQALLTARRAADADLASAHGAIVPAEFPNIPPPGDWVENVRRQCEEMLRTRDRSVELLRVRQRELGETARQHEIALVRLRETEGASARAIEEETLSRQNFAITSKTILADYSNWQRGLLQLRCPNGDELAETFADWLEQRAGPSPLEMAGDEAVRAVLAALATERATAEQRDAALALELDAVEGERRALEGGGQRVPLAPPWRKASREGRPGAPLWQVCDFRADTPPAVRAGLEAALQAAGLLDAWLLPDGTLLDPLTDDAFLVAGAGRPDVAAEQMLARWIEPSIDAEIPAAAAIDESTVGRLLSIIGGERNAGMHWVDPDGSWQLGPICGHANKAEAEHIGEGARAAARRRRLVELVSRRDDLLEARNGIARDLASLQARETAAGEERRRLPDHELLRTAGAAIEHAIAAVRRADDARQAAAGREGDAKTRHDSMRARRDQDAADLGLGSWVERLDVLSAATASYREALAGLGPIVQLWQHTWRALGEAKQRHSQTEATFETCARRESEAAGVYEEARGRVAAMTAAVGATESELLDQVRKQKTHKEPLAAARRQTDQTERTKFAEIAAAASDVERFTAERQERDAARQSAIAHLHHLADEGLVREAEPSAVGPEGVDGNAWSATFAVELARSLNEKLQDAPVADDAWQRQQQDVFQHIDRLRDELIPHGYHPDATPVDEGLVIVRCPHQGKLCAMSEFDAVLAEDLALRQRLLDEREREVIENHLLGEAAAELQRLIRDAERWVANTNCEITSRPTSTGMQLKFVWEVDPDGPPGLEAARRQLLRTTALWSPEERAGLARFLQERIRAERNANEAGTWRDQLASALDYRSWHRFAVLRQQDGQWRRLTRATYGTGSGGEKALALTIPQFAAAAAHYASADPAAPRLILLDEVFVGIDSDMRAKCMGLLAAFDLDFVMTSEREWGCYPTLPGLAICQLSSRPGIDAVLATHWVWNGEELRQQNGLPPGNNGPELQPDAANEES